MIGLVEVEESLFLNDLDAISESHFQLKMLIPEMLLFSLGNPVHLQSNKWKGKAQGPHLSIVCTHKYVHKWATFQNKCRIY